ncbi:hypothetical protein ACQP10_27905 [Streptosporangium sandarakinum]|uniref:hypothetical protein n=1 Tax=Streptosporangium sandarakinum TaxID=1260955 RepID=UPI003D8F4502
MTLITGDRVVMTGRGHRVEPGPGRQDVGFRSQMLKGHLYVVPSDAQPLLTQGVLDRRLFDVTQLLEWRYGDADRGDIPLITQSGTGQAPALRSAQDVKGLAGLGMTTLSLPKSGAAQAWKDMAGGARTLAAGTAKIWLDGRLSYTLDRSTEQIGATEAWKQGMTGEGVTVAVLDSGYDPDHPGKDRQLQHGGPRRTRDRPCGTGGEHALGEGGHTVRRRRGQQRKIAGEQSRQR